MTMIKTDQQLKEERSKDLPKIKKAQKAQKRREVGKIWIDVSDQYNGVPTKKLVKK